MRELVTAVQLATVAVLLAVVSSAQAAVLGEGFQITFGSAGPGLPFESEVLIELQINKEVSLFGDQLGLFTDLSLTPADLGATFSATRQSDPGFDRAVTLLTNGTLDEVGLRSKWIGPSANYVRVDDETTLFAEHPGLTGIDFAGNLIDSISLRVDRLDFSPLDPVSNTGARWIVGATMIVEGHIVIAEPSAVWLLALCLAALAGLRRRRREG